MQIKILKDVQLDEEGILINLKNDAIHLCQGDMDGACGPYCVAMAWLILRKINRNEITRPEKIDYRTKEGKLLQKFHELGPFTLEGSSANNLENILGKKCNTGTGKSLFPKIIKSLESENPVIIDVRGKKEDDLNHWTLAIGYSEDYIFLLDPGYELSASNLWNAAVSRHPSKNRFGYQYINTKRSIEVEVWNYFEIS